MANLDYSHTLSHGYQTGFERSKQWFQRIHIDLPLLLLLVLLSFFGLFILYGASNQSMAMVEKQLVHLVMGFIALLCTAQVTPRFFSRISVPIYVFGVLLLVAVLVFGSHSKGAQRWLDLPGIPKFQPAEIMKLALPMMLAWYLSKCHVPPKFKEIAVAFIVLAIPALLIIKQPDLGTAILIACAGVSVIFFAGISWRLIFSVMGLLAALMPILWLFVMRDYQKQRVLTFLSPETDPLGSGWNTIQAKIAIGSGGLQGKGWLLGSQSQLEFLPESHTDFIIAVLAEELGLVGVLALLALYFLIALRCLYLSANCSTLYARLLSGSLSVTFFLYVFVNIGMVSGILPVVGVPLPLISYGGTSVISLLAAFGVLMSMSTHDRK